MAKRLNLGLLAALVLLAGVLLVTGNTAVHGAGALCNGLKATIEGTSGDDTLTGTSGADVISGSSFPLHARSAEARR